MSAVPDGMYMQPWEFTINNAVKPDELNIKLLSSTTEDGAYTVISQLENISVACTNNGGDYSGTYPVWLSHNSYSNPYWIC